MAFFRLNFDGGGGFVETGLPTKSIPPGTWGKTRTHIYHRFELCSVLIINPCAYVSLILMLYTHTSLLLFLYIYHGMIRLENWVLM